MSTLCVLCCSAESNYLHYLRLVRASKHRGLLTFELSNLVFAGLVGDLKWTLLVTIERDLNALNLTTDIFLHRVQ